MSSIPISFPRPVAGTGQNIAIGIASVQNAAAFNAHTTLIQISVLGNCHVEIGPNPTATATSMLVKATDPPLVISICRGDKIAVIQDAASTGNANIVEMSY